MSSGAFTTTKYKSDSGGIYRIRVQPETTQLAISSTTNGPPAGATTEEISANARGGKRQNGVTARTISVKFTGAIPDDYLGTPLTIPVLDPDTFVSYTSPPGKTGTYLGSAIEVIGFSPERRR